MTDIDDLMQESMEAVEKGGMDGLGKITELAEEMDELSNEIDDLKDQIKSRQDRVNLISTDELPSTMDEVGGGIEGLTLKSGRRLTLRPFHSGKIPPEVHSKAIEWLAKHGYGDLVKTAVSIGFAMKEFNKAKKLAEKLQKDGMNVSATQSVHTGTLGKWVKEMSEQGKFGEIPEELFTPKTFRKAIIK